MVTEELHSITFETQICLYGLTIDLEVGISRNIYYLLVTFSGIGHHLKMKAQYFLGFSTFLIHHFCFNLGNQYVKYSLIRQHILFWLNINDKISQSL